MGKLHALDKVLKIARANNYGVEIIDQAPGICLVRIKKYFPTGKYWQSNRDYKMWLCEFGMEAETILKYLEDDGFYER
jgi:hypothetical protein